MHPARHLALLLLLLALLFPVPSSAATTQLIVDNDTDAFVPGLGSWDQDYTQGVRLDVFGDHPMLRRWETHIPGFARTPLFQAGYSLGQEIYTPVHISNPNLIRDDRPFAGWLYLSRTLIAEDVNAARSVEIKLGTIGPSSQADRVQTWWHRELGTYMPRGWRYQLSDEPGLELRWDERRRPLGYQRYADILPHGGFVVGNVLTQAHAGVTLRLGPRLPDDFGPWRNAPAAAARLRRSGLTAYVFARAEGRYVARNIFLDGNTFVPGPRVHRVPLVAETQLGGEIGRGRLGIRYVFSYTTPEFRERYVRHEYGSFVLQF